ncbi:hypothetical protein SERLA73DRAFT_150332 [Serpula lacrymans var. lacrymans S7.3]|uniref:CCHC-type domain-containing protein n=1 Tax=Serpula lacrymans var. lacrymans (strain S7.3) TaxID=936435 RepID=F8PM45_SERL3|nr:hypothetical protein SERLA73DRAFT_150332 [Serpula lacrymans var. lacrymans S7.3]
MTDSMTNLIRALLEAGPSQTQLTILAGLTPEIQEWMQRMMEAEVARRVTEATEKEREGRMRAHQAAERVEEEAADLRRKAGYKDDFILITLLKKNMNYTVVDKLYVSRLPPNRYKEWRKLLLNYDQIWREREKEKKGYFGQMERTGTRKDDRGSKKAYSGTKDRTRTVYTGAGQPMEIDKAKYRKEGLCFKCGVKGHIRKFCPTEGKNKVDLHAMIAALSKEEETNEKDLYKESKTKKEGRNGMKDANQKRGLVKETPNKSTTAAEAAHSKITDAAAAAGRSLKSAASAADTERILIPNMAHSTEKNAVETMKDRSGAPVNEVQPMALPLV